jgi:predicted GTPase
VRELIAGEGGSVLVAAASSADVVALACEGLAQATTAPSGLPVYPMDAIPVDLKVDQVRILPCEPPSRDALSSWLIGHDGWILEEDISPFPSPGVPVITVSAASTGSGKTALTRRVARTLARSGVRVAVVRHPIAGLLLWDRFDPRIVRTPPELMGPIEEREELAPLLGAGIPVVSGLDVSRSFTLAAREADVIVWDGGGAAEPYVEAELSFLALDLLRPHTFEPDRVRRASVIVLTKADSASEDQIRELERQVRDVNPDATVVLADLAIGVQPGNALTDRRVVIVEDANSLLLGGMSAGAGAVAARRFRCGVVDPRPFAVGAIADALRTHPHIGPVIPSLGRTPQELDDLAASVSATPGDAILWASNADPAQILDDARPLVRAFGELTEIAGPSLQEVLAPFLPGHG